MKIVVGYIMNPAGDAALARGIAEARQRGAELLVVHSSEGGHAEDVETVLRYQEVEQDIQRRLEAEDIDGRVEEYTRGNTPATDLIQVAADEEADLIVIGLRKRSKVGKLILGSNALEILMQAPCAVLTVRASYDD